MAKTEGECAAEIMSTISTGILQIAAKASARVSELEDENAELLRRLRDAETRLSEFDRVMAVASIS